MTNCLYALSVVGALLLGMAVYALCLHRADMKPVVAAIALPISAVLAFLLAKVLYVLLQINYIWPRYDFASFLRMNPTEFSFFGGMLGVMLGVLISGRLQRLSLRQTVDAFAPAMALLCAAWKFSEYFLGDFGSGSYVENEAQQFFPLAIRNQYDEWYYAVFLLAGLCALCVFVVSFLRYEGGCHADIAGMFFGRTAFYLAVPLVLCESLRAECMRWGFVKCEQVLFSVTIAAIIFALCAGTHVSGKRRFLPLIGVLVIMAGLVGVEFMLDKLSYPEYVGYSIMLILLIVLSMLEVATVRCHLRNNLNCIKWKSADVQS